MFRLSKIKVYSTEKINCIREILAISDSSLWKSALVSLQKIFFMQSLADLFISLDPFSKQSPWAVKDFEGYPLSLRPVYIPDDLRVLHRWIKPSAGGVNTLYTGDPARLLRHYRQMALSPRCQSFAVLQNEKMICQFDVKGMEKDPLYFRLPTSAYDMLLKCLIPPSGLQNKIWIQGLSLLLGLFYLLPESGEVFIEAPLYPVDFAKDLQDMGFESFKDPEKPDPLIMILKHRKELSLPRDIAD